MTTDPPFRTAVLDLSSGDRKRSPMLGAMTTLQGDFDELTITENTTIRGAVRGDLTVLNGRVAVQGVVGGQLIARGGHTRVQGVVKGITLAGGEVEISVGTILGTKILQEDGSWQRPANNSSITVGPDPTWFDARDVL